MIVAGVYRKLDTKYLLTADWSIYFLLEVKKKSSVEEVIATSYHDDGHVNLKIVE